MTTGQDKEPGSLKIIGSISKFAGALVGTAVATSKQIAKSVAQPGKSVSGKFAEEAAEKQSKRKKIKVRKTGPKGAKVRKKAAKRKQSNSAKKGAASTRKPAQSLGKRKKGISAKKKRTGRKTKELAKGKGSVGSQNHRKSQAGAGANIPAGRVKNG